MVHAPFWNKPLYMLLHWVLSQTDAPLRWSLSCNPAIAGLSVCSHRFQTALFSDRRLCSMKKSYHGDRLCPKCFHDVWKQQQQRLAHLCFFFYSCVVNDDTEDTSGVNLSVSNASGSHVLTLVIFHTLQVNKIRFLFRASFPFLFIYFYEMQCDKFQDALEWCFPRRIYKAQQPGKIRLWTDIHFTVKGS